MIRVLLDTDVVLDFLLDRHPFAHAATAIWQAGEQGQADLYVAAITPINVFYVTQKLMDEATARGYVMSILQSCRVCTVDQLCCSLLPWHRRCATTRMQRRLLPLNFTSWMRL